MQNLSHSRTNVPTHRSDQGYLGPIINPRSGGEIFCRLMLNASEMAFLFPQKVLEIPLIVALSYIVLHIVTLSYIMSYIVVHNA